MPYVSIQIPDRQLKKTSELARRAGLKRAEYIRKALERYNEEMERKLLAEHFARASALCREESLKTCKEFEVADFPLEN